MHNITIKAPYFTPAFEKFESGKFILHLGSTHDVCVYALAGRLLHEDIAKNYGLIKETNGISLTRYQRLVLHQREMARREQGRSSKSIFETEEERKARAIDELRKLKETIPNLEDSILGGGYIGINHHKRLIYASDESSQYGSLPNSLVEKCLSGLNYAVSANMSQKDIRDKTRFWTEYFFEQLKI